MEIDCDALDSFDDRRSFHHAAVDVEKDTQGTHRMEVVAQMVVVPRDETCEEETCHTEESLVEEMNLAVAADMIAVVEQLHKVVRAVGVVHRIHQVAQKKEDKEDQLGRTALQFAAKTRLAVSFPLAAFQIAVVLVNVKTPQMYQVVFLMTCSLVCNAVLFRSAFHAA